MLSVIKRPYKVYELKRRFFEEQLFKRENFNQFCHHCNLKTYLLFLEMDNFETNKYFSKISGEHRPLFSP